ncbi:uncharacterized protein LOC62_04G006251 [Vanrija pseudolonga]|uniref:RNI-like protein n=1 Tax=Vanrija pseudolonga TaxID=143232 RepID=A0AAF0YA07_9TREE|nr:hypothetical protein LOC62_04G006251 [Vanrija pseudolonga]
MNVDVEYSDLEGVEGAEAILAAITPRSRAIKAAYNQLGDDGVEALVASLPVHIEQLDLTDNDVGDRGLLAALGYAARSGLRHLSLAFNAVHLDEATTPVAIAALNASHLESLTLFSNHLEPGSVTELFEHLAAPRLATLHLSRCNVDDAAATAVASYLASPRAAALTTLDLGNNWLSALAAKELIDAVERAHFGLQHLSLASHGLRGTRGCILFKADYDPKLEAEPRPQMMVEMAQQLHTRLPAALGRNRELRRRTMAAAARAVGPARILLHAAEPAAPTTATTAATPATTTTTTTTTPPTFPFTRLPAEIQQAIARHAWGDAHALTEAQWGKVVRYASDRTTLGGMLACPPSALGFDARVGLALTAWCERLGCAQWEKETRGWEPPSPRIGA